MPYVPQCHTLAPVPPPGAVRSSDSAPVRPLGGAAVRGGDSSQDESSDESSVAVLCGEDDCSPSDESPNIIALVAAVQWLQRAAAVRRENVWCCVAAGVSSHRGEPLYGGALCAVQSARISKPQRLQGRKTQDDRPVRTKPAR